MSGGTFGISELGFAAGTLEPFLPIPGLMVKAQCSCDVAIKMNSSIDSTNVLVANWKLLYWAKWLLAIRLTIFYGSLKG